LRQKIPELFTRNSRVLPYRQYYGFHSFRLLTDFVCLHNYEFWLSLYKIVRSSVILLLPLFPFEPLDTCFKVPPFTAPRRWDITSIDRNYWHFWICLFIFKASYELPYRRMPDYNRLVPCPVGTWRTKLKKLLSQISF
jgi:hypothetical protein